MISQVSFKCTPTEHMSSLPPPLGTLEELLFPVTLLEVLCEHCSVGHTEASTSVPVSASTLELSTSGLLVGGGFKCLVGLKLEGSRLLACDVHTTLLGKGVDPRMVLADLLLWLWPC